MALAQIIRSAGTIIWNGPIGVFEFDAFGEGTKQMALAIAEATANGAFSIAGGGDTLAAIAKYDLGDRISYISTGGGAFLEYLEGKTLPAIEILEQRAVNKDFSLDAASPTELIRSAHDAQHENSCHVRSRVE